MNERHVIVGHLDGLEKPFGPDGNNTVLVLRSIHPSKHLKFGTGEGTGHP